MKVMSSIVMMISMFVFGSVLQVFAQSVDCDLTIGCQWEMTVVEKGTYTAYEFRLTPEGQSTQILTFNLVEPLTVVANTNAGISQKVSGLIVVHETQIILRDGNGTVISQRELKSTDGGTPILQTFTYQICATSPTEPALCHPVVTLTAL